MRNSNNSSINRISAENIMRVFITLTLLLFTTHSVAQQSHQHLAPAVGIHGMAIFDHDGKYYASHMPLVNSIHAHQIIFSFKLKDRNLEELENLSKQHDLITLVPEKFDLRHLMDGTLTQMRADIYAGHFERGGTAKLKHALVTVDKVILNEVTTDAENGKYYLLPTSEYSAIIVHRIAKLPSFDQILAADFEQTARSKIVPYRIELTEGLPFDPANKTATANSIELTHIQQYYLEEQDFR